MSSYISSQKALVLAGAFMCMVLVLGCLTYVHAHAMRGEHSDIPPIYTKTLTMILTFEDHNSKAITTHVGTTSAFHLLLARTDAEKKKGLGERTSLPIDQAMLFEFDEPYKYGIWMKDMHFPIDVLWLDSEGTIVDMVHDMEPSSYPTAYHPQKAAVYVVETNSGVIDTLSLEIGDKAVVK